MKDLIFDFDELLLKTRLEDSRKFLKESIDAYRAGAYRSSIISLWIAVCVDIVEKIKELKNTGDKKAHQVYDEIKKIEPTDLKAMQEKEREIVDIAEDFGFISHIEKTEFVRLKEDRNYCAHPFFSEDGMQFNPSNLLVKSYIVNCSNFLLVKRPIHGKAILEKICNELDSPYLKSDIMIIKSIIDTDEYLCSMNESAKRNLIKIYLKRLFDLEKSDLSENSIKYCIILAVINEHNSELFKKIFFDYIDGLTFEGLKIFYFIRLINIIPGVISILPSKHLTIINSFVDTHSLYDEEKRQVIKLLLIEILKLSEKINKIKEIMIKKLDTLNDDVILQIVEFEPKEWVKAKMIQLFISSSSFNCAYFRGNLLLKYKKVLKYEDLKFILEGIFSEQKDNYYNQVLGSSNIEEILIELFEATMDNDIENLKLWEEFINKLHETQFFDLRKRIKNTPPF
ncbi:MAG: hypothetical protein M0R46_14835 [Candidatus Muirbacterium halophilum]|nr:hypothetical protein [Candidatus Muirbacterium halophilum]